MVETLVRLLHIASESNKTEIYNRNIIQNQDRLERDRKEKRWIHRLATVVPKGLNLMD